MQNTEIERKFLVEGNFKEYVTDSQHIVQAYILNAPERCVRIRIYGDKGYITIKGKTSESGLSRFEWEKEISLQEAKKLLNLCNLNRIEKIRHLIPQADHTIEVDEFEGKNKGLILAEIELQSEDETFDKPHWLGKEVTGDIRYYNAQLIEHPYTEW